MLQQSTTDPDAFVFNPSYTSLSNAAGRLLFSSQGVYVYDSLWAIMPGAPLIVSSPSNWSDRIWRQPVAIAPAPANDFEYYLFYWSVTSSPNEPAYTLTWAKVDMRRNSSKGAVVEKGHQITHTAQGHLTVVRHANNRDFWVVVRTPDTRGFQAFLLDVTGVGTAPVVSLAGQAQYPDESHLNASANGRRLVCGAIARTNIADEYLTCVYDFDNASGRVSNELVLRRTPRSPVQRADDGRPVGATAVDACAFSPDSRLLYAIERSTPAERLLQPRRSGDVWQYDLTQPSPSGIAASRFLVSNLPVPTSVFDVMEPAGMQLAPDGTVWIGQIYYRQWYQNAAVPQRSAAGIIRYPNVVGAGCGLEPEGYQYQWGQFFWWYRSLPNVITNMLYAPPLLNHEVGCAGDSVQFWASSAGLPTGLRWDFGDPGSGPANTAAGRQVAHRYPQGGTYPVRLTLADGRVLTQTITVPSAETDFSGANIFTPNGDGLNDTFRPVLRGEVAGGARLRVFSRWGQRLFEGSGPAPQWDGAGAASGEYFYQLDYADCQGNPRHRRGILTLNR